MRLLEQLRHLHPLHRARKSATGRFFLRAADRPTWIKLPSIHFKVRGKFLSHGLSYGATQEANPTALALACLHQFSFRSFWDVGANFGYYSWLLKSDAPELELLMIEPLPANARLIRETIRRNRLSGVTLIEGGASDRAGEGVLHADTLAGATSSLVDGETFEQHHFGVAPESIGVKLLALDTLPGPVDFIKIDVEGHEAAVLRGAMQTIARDQPILFIECSHPGQPCLSVLEGYQIVDADRLTLDRGEGSTNFFCFPPRHAGSIKELI